eukprot:jgi/Chrzof1/2168/Cz11g04230.t1
MQDLLCILQALVLKQAADLVEQEDGITCDVIDLRTLMPWDVNAVTKSVNKTGRLIVSHEAPITSGFGAEITAAVAQRCFLSLEAPPMRVCGADTPFPLVYEPVYLPTVGRVVEAIRSSAEY